jgi:molybdopterin converting factor small subunit
MRVEVKMLSGLIPATGGTVELDRGASGVDLLGSMGVKSSEGIIMIVNGRRQELGTELKEGDRIHFMTPLAGG